MAGAWLALLVPVQSARILRYPSCVGSRSCSDQTVAVLLWQLPLADEDGLDEARRTLAELTGVAPVPHPSPEQLAALFSQLRGGVWRCARRLNAQEQLATMGVGMLQRAAMLGVSQQLEYKALDGNVLRWRYVAAGFIEADEELAIGSQPLQTVQAGRVRMPPGGCARGLRSFHTPLPWRIRVPKLALPILGPCPFWAPAYSGPLPTLGAGDGDVPDAEPRRRVPRDPVRLRVYRQAAAAGDCVEGLLLDRDQGRPLGHSGIHSRQAGRRRVGLARPPAGGGEPQRLRARAGGQAQAQAPPPVDARATGLGKRGGAVPAEAACGGGPLPSHSSQVCGGAVRGGAG